MFSKSDEENTLNKNVDNTCFHYNKLLIFIKVIPFIEKDICHQLFLLFHENILS